jgi:hypothetical protein
LHLGSQSIAVRDAAIAPHASAGLHGTAGSHFGAPPQEPPEVQMATNVPTVASSPPSTALQPGGERQPSPVLASILKVFAHRQP